jgi:hypothetical protein
MIWISTNEDIAIGQSSISIKKLLIGRCSYFTNNTIALFGSQNRDISSVALINAIIQINNWGCTSIPVWIVIYPDSNLACAPPTGSPISIEIRKNSILEW